ncbi:type II toxin-antitoxin system VapC family toxin [Desulfonema magnum]|uniref:PIN domain-containing protein n=1 Tax=Desulfonema magnum TaxID=45655 RepID=A0A975BN19_9BACT|nr:PIN domain-containing protein [Desulfonema magnum]QTA88277.1 PIN domain-containing protein [Desulfonema magnum]
MNRYVTDSHALIWHLQNLPNLSARVRQIFSQIDGGAATAVIPTIVPVEMIYLAEKRRIPGNLLSAVLNFIGTNSVNYELAPLDFSVVSSMRQISRSVVPDMPDRIIAATALALDLPLLSRDSAISNLSEIEVIW